MMGFSKLDVFLLIWNKRAYFTHPKRYLRSALCPKNQRHSSKHCLFNTSLRIYVITEPKKVTCVLKGTDRIFESYCDYGYPNVSFESKHLLLLWWKLKVWRQCHKFYMGEYLTHLLPMHPFYKPWKHHKILQFSDAFGL